MWEGLKIYGVRGRNLEAVKNFCDGCEAYVTVENKENEMLG